MNYQKEGKILQNILSSREIAIGFWIIVIIIFIIFNKNLRHPILDVIKVACSRQLVIPFVVMLFYAILLSYLFSLTHFWKWLYVKEIIIWFLFVGIPICYRAIGKEIENDYFKKIIIDNLKFIVLAEFIIGYFTFHIIIEILLIPFLILLFMIDVITEAKEEYMSVKKITSALLAYIGFLILGLALRKAVIDYQSLANLDTFISFIIPIVLSVLFLPVAYGFAVYAKYQTIFIKMRFREPDDKKIQMHRKLKVIQACTLSYSKLCLFERESIKHIYTKMSKSEFDNLIKGFRSG